MADTLNRAVTFRLYPTARQPDAGWIDSALHITKAQETYWRSLLPTPETAV